ncbi:amidohydrolase family protein [Novosphingobium sp. JCM 18896]|jgi:uncharacterized protein|uniref:amidohydrolase family protein n=1 Tax=Novosphingobium sp. JCM 18896 TaxID=2989731 RepID=UPI002221AECF|nr:amidohydrolase family protein [Novosphingobium sp. JCM 18896]MCW1432374.1 amidohydrolase [Novosphingobium sp. JCM 18896]
MVGLADKIKVIDTDTHIVEPYDLWTSRISVAKWGDKVPQVRHVAEEKEDFWFFNGERLGPAAGTSMAGWHEYAPKHPKTWNEVNPFASDANERLKKMDEYGIWAQVLYPNVAGFGAGQYLGLEDPELMLLCVQAYNDWIAEWASADPRRLLPQMALPFWDIDLSVKEMERATRLGHSGVIMGGQPEFFGQPKLTDPYWDPLWASAQEKGLPIDFHIASGDLSNFHLHHSSVGEHAAFSGLAVMFTMENVKTLSQIIMGGICHRFPKLNFVSVESGIGWLPFALEMLDWMWLNCGVRQEHPEYDLMPSEYFQRQIYGCFWFERGTLKSTIEQIGANNILYESDYPHPTSMSPGPASIAVPPRQYIDEVLGDLPEDVSRKVLHDNAARIYNLT